MNSNFPIKNHFQEENDFFLSYINSKLREFEHQIAVLNFEEEKGGLPAEYDRLLHLNNRHLLLKSQKQFRQMKDHYYLALNHGKPPNPNSSANKKGKKQEKDYSEEKKFREIQGSLEVGDFKEDKPMISAVLNMIHVAKSLKFLKGQDEFLNYLYSNNMKLEEINDILTFYKSCFSKSADSNFATNEAKIQFSSNMLEIYCDQGHPLHNHFKGIREKIETIGKSQIFLKLNPSQIHRAHNQNVLQNQINKNDIHNQSGSQSDDTRRVLKKNFSRSKANLENYDGDSEKSFHKSEEVKEENEEDFIEDRAKSDGENNKDLELEHFLNISRPKYKNLNNNNSKQRASKPKKNKRPKKIFEDSGDHATGSASDRNYADYKTKIFSWGIRGMQKNNKNNKPPKGFDTDKDMKL